MRPVHCYALAAAVLGATAAHAQSLPPSSSAMESEDSDLVRIGQVDVLEIRVEGASVFSAAELDAFVSPYENRSVTVEELHALRQALSGAYLDRGYVNSGVVIPDQRVANGVVILQAIEGELTTVEIDGALRISEKAIGRRIDRHAGQPLNIDDIQFSLQALEQDPLVERVNAELLPGAELGQSVLRLGITEGSPWEFRAGVSNHRSPSVGEDRGSVGFTYYGLIGNGDRLSADFSLTEGADDQIVSYLVPLGPVGTSLEAFAAEQDTDIVEAPFTEIDITSHVESWGLRARRPFISKSDGSLVGSVGFEHKQSESTLLGMPFSFSPGDVDGQAKGSAVSLGVEWIRQFPGFALAVGGTVQSGVDALDPTIFDDSAGSLELPDSEFTALISQAQLVRRIAWRDSRLLTRVFLQSAYDPLLAMYKSPVGGRYSVRGYRENQFVRDNAGVASIEYQFPLFVDDGGRIRNSLRLGIFADYGSSWDENEQLATSRTERISSIGLGLLWAPLDGLETELYWGDPRSAEPPTANDSLQDDGFHFMAVYRKRF